jgi:hypothetical protein
MLSQSNPQRSDQRSRATGTFVVGKLEGRTGEVPIKHLVVNIAPWIESEMKQRLMKIPD